MNREICNPALVHTWVQPHPRVCPCGICRGPGPVLRCRDPGVTGEVPVCATALLQPGSPVS